MVPITGKPKRKKRHFRTQEETYQSTDQHKGALINSTKLPKIFPSTSPTSLDIRDIRSPFLLSVKNETGKESFYTWHHEDLCNTYTVIDQQERSEISEKVSQQNINAVMTQSHAKL
jgi:hypothetical protein